MSQFNVSISVTETNDEGSFVHASVSLATPTQEAEGKSAASKKKERDGLSDLIKRAAEAADASISK